MKALFAVALEFELTIPEVLQLLENKGHKVNSDYRTKLSREQYNVVAGSQGKAVTKYKPQTTKQRFGTIKFYAADKEFGFITDPATGEDHYFRASHLKTETVADGNPVVFTPVPSKRKPGTKEARAVSHFADCKNIELLCATYLTSDNTFVRQTVLENIQSGDFRYLLNQELEQLPTVDTAAAYIDLVARIDGYRAWLPDPTDKQSFNDIAFATLRKGPAAVYTIRWWLDGRTKQKPAEATIVEAYPSLAQNHQFAVLDILSEPVRRELLTRQGKLEGYPTILHFVEGYVRKRNDMPSNDGKTIADYEHQQLTDYPLYKWTAQLVRLHPTQE